MNIATCILAGVLAGPLSAEAVAHFRQRGWVKATDLLEPQAAAQVTLWTGEITALPELPGRHMVYREPAPGAEGQTQLQRVENFCPYHPQMDELVRRGALAQAVMQLLDGPALLFKDKSNYKLPGGAGFELHQDQQAGWSRYAPLFVTAMVSVDRATIANGCLEIADMPRATAMLGQEWKPLTLAELGGAALTSVPTEPGDVIFFDSYVAHASQRNFSNDSRRILYLTYNRQADGDHRARYFADKRQSFPPDIEREPGKEYRFRV